MAGNHCNYCVSCVLLMAGSWLRKEVNNMAVIYVALIVKGKRTYDSVPDLIKPQVKEMLIDLELAELVTE